MDGPPWPAIEAWAAQRMTGRPVDVSPSMDPVSVAWFRTLAERLKRSWNAKVSTLIVRLTEDEVRACRWASPPIAPEANGRWMRRYALIVTRVDTEAVLGGGQPPSEKSPPGWAKNSIRKFLVSGLAPSAIGRIQGDPYPIPWGQARISRKSRSALFHNPWKPSVSLAAKALSRRRSEANRPSGTNG